MKNITERQKIKDLISWAEEQVKNGQEVIDNCAAMGWGDDMKDVRAEMAHYQKVKEALEELLRRMALDN